MHIESSCACRSYAVLGQSFVAHVGHGCCRPRAPSFPVFPVAPHLVDIRVVWHPEPIVDTSRLIGQRPVTRPEYILTMALPPSMSITSPFMKPPASDASIMHGPAISVGLPGRPAKSTVSPSSSTTDAVTGTGRRRSEWQCKDTHQRESA